jgi:hypothetical protein
MNSLLLALSAFSSLTSQVQNIFYVILGIAVILMLILYRTVLHAIDAYRSEFFIRLFSLTVSFGAILGLGVLGYYLSTLNLFSMVSRILFIGIGILLGLIIGGLVIKARHRTTIIRGIGSLLIIFVLTAMLIVIILIIIQLALNVDLFDALTQLML